MCSEIQAACRETAQPIPESDADWRAAFFDSLALQYADVLHELAQLRGGRFLATAYCRRRLSEHLLNQLCADACGIRVIAGPVEASTLGNIGIQLMTLDELNNVDDFRQVVSTTANLTTFTPNPDSEIAHYVARIHSTRKTKELCA
ncbi:FGGY-family carbohydrate kinase [Enterobacter hormaechei]